jgi:hypothetical protein
MKQSQEIVSAVGEQLEILIIIVGQGPRTFSVTKLVHDRNRKRTYQSVNTENNHSA